MTDKVMEKRGKGNRKCRFCARPSSLIRKYGLYVCRQCFYQNGVQMGFKRYS
ncbi:MAG TPA: 30S ribosomal protein S14 [archaeon]|nr:30S ribosomal protein S14 [archaeon]HLD81020.1 30S ribosomal protein S14 [archaeon]